jgi:hypothetical protein
MLNIVIFLFKFSFLYFWRNIFDLHKFQKAPKAHFPTLLKSVKT